MSADAQGLRDCARLAESAAKWDLSDSKGKRLVKALETLEVRFWLQDRGLEETFHMLMTEDRHSLKGLMELTASELEKVVPSKLLRAKLIASIEEGKNSLQKSPKNVGAGATFSENLFRVMIFLVILTGKYTCLGCGCTVWIV